jgi:hypothetical protein
MRNETDYILHVSAARRMSPDGDGDENKKGPLVRQAEMLAHVHTPRRVRRDL